MFDRAFFEATLPDQVTQKAKHSQTGSATVRVRLANGETHTVSSIVEKADGWIAFEVYHPKGKQRKHPRDERELGAPQFDLDRLIVPYEVITDVLVTTETPKAQAGFKA